MTPSAARFANPIFVALDTPDVSRALSLIARKRLGRIERLVEILRALTEE